MRRLLFMLHRRAVIKSVRFWIRHLDEKSLFLVLAVFIGAAAAILAALLHWLVGALIRFDLWAHIKSGNSIWAAGAVMLLPLVGLAASFLVQKTMGGPRYAKSLSLLILSLHRRRCAIPITETVSHLLSSGLAVGLGGSAGLEAPSVLTGAAVGANTASFLHIDRRKRPLLLGCGAAAAIAAIFDSPVAGVLFAAEVLLPEFSVSALVPMLMSSAVSTVVSRLLIVKSQFFLAQNAPWQPEAVPFYILCGFVCALVGVFVIHTAYTLSSKLKKNFRNQWSRLVFGGIMLCALLTSFPFLRGQGYWYIEKLYTGELDRLIASAPLLALLPSVGGQVALMLAVAVFVKVIASVLTVDSGGDGGIFAPSMFIGAFTGFAFARLVNTTGLMQLQECNFVAVGMCGVFAAVMRAPLTAVFLIAEVTGGYVLLVPLMIVSSSAFFSARLFEPSSIYSKALVDAHLLGTDRDQELLKRQPVRLNIERFYHAFAPRDGMDKLTALVERTADAVFPVLDDSGRLLGVIHLNKIMSAMLEPQLHSLLLACDLMVPPRGMLSPDDDLALAMKYFDQYNSAFLPVCDKDGLFHGFVSKEKVFAKYRSMVREADAF
ncbi:MAG: chloride channel protein [Victivallaceae bacterium]|nr:chloride channel protein [Victivallaceae bacterium]